MCSVAQADVYVTYDNKTNEVIDFAPDLDLVMQKGWTREALKGDLIDYPLSHHATYYKYKDGRFIMNVKKMSDEAIAEEAAKALIEEEALIQKRIRKLAIQELKNEGVTFKHVKED